MGITTASRVVSSPELLEVILLNLSMRDILVNAHRVNRIWNAIINASPSLQQYLFFAPTIRSPTDEPKWIKNQLLSEKFPGWLNDIRATKRYFIDVGPEADMQIRFHYSDQPGPYRRYNFTNIEILNRTDLGARSEVYYRSEASWRHMLVMQPPVNLLKIVQAKNVRKRWNKEREIRDMVQEGGVRMGSLYDIMIAYICETYGSFGLQWNMFQVEEDAEAPEDGGLNDYLYRKELIEENEEKESITLILMDILGMKRRNKEQLLSRFGSNAVREDTNN